MGCLTCPKCGKEAVKLKTRSRRTPSGIFVCEACGKQSSGNIVNGLTRTDISQRVNHNMEPRSKSGYKGVYATKNGYYSMLRIDKGKRLYLGHYMNEIEAAIAYNEAVIKHRPKGAYLNEL